MILSSGLPLALALTLAASNGKYNLYSVHYMHVILYTCICFGVHLEPTILFRLFISSFTLISGSECKTDIASITQTVSQRQIRELNLLLFDLVPDILSVTTVDLGMTE